MRITVLGGDGYLGWPTALHLSAAGHEVSVMDNFVRRSIDVELGTNSLRPIQSMRTRVDAWYDVSGKRLHQRSGDVTNYGDVARELFEFHPDAVVHLAEQRSAPYSMMSHQHAAYTQQNNVIGTLNVIHAIAEVDPFIHLVKLGTMGEYGTPNIDIEEGWLDVEHNGRRDRVLYPKRAGSWYHLSKVHDSHNIEFACRAWGLRATDLNQGVVYGQWTDETQLNWRLATRFDYDAVFGTVLNRFVVQAALGYPLTVYGDGSQTRGFINLRDAVRCIELACTNPSGVGEYRVFNQITETFSVMELAARAAKLSPHPVEINTVDNPRIEQMGHYYNVVHSALPALGLEPHLLDDEMIKNMMMMVALNGDRINPEVIAPRVRWRR